MLINQMTCDSIDQLIDVLDETCVRAKVAKCPAEADLWQAEAGLLHSEGKDVALLDLKHAALAQAALQEWDIRFTSYCQLFDGSQLVFAFWFMTFRDTARRTGTLPLGSLVSEDGYAVYRASEVARLIVRNISWCTAFAFYLPRAVPSLKRQATEAGLQMLAILWLEGVAKLKDRADILQRSVPYPTDLFGLVRIDQLLDACVGNWNHGSLDDD
jgi:hypothetical protein